MTVGADIVALCEQEEIGHREQLMRDSGGYRRAQTGGRDCKGTYDSYHDGDNYFSIDFSWRNKDGNGNQVYSRPSYGGWIPILAAASGRVVEVGTNANHANGYFVRLDHDTDLNAATGFTTVYAHMRSTPNVYYGQTVQQGDILGWMGNTGISTADHLHFGIRYKVSFR